jgi:hypothetical protein
MKAAIKLDLSNIISIVIFITYSRVRAKRNITFYSEVIFRRLRTLVEFEEY